MHDNVIEINNLTLPYCYNNFSISFPKNKVSVVSGPNNCGKTTLIRILDGQIKTKNQVFFGTVGLERHQITDIGSQIKTIIREELYFTKDTVMDEIYFTLNSCDCKNKKSIYKELIKVYKLTKYQNSNPNTLSHYLKLKLSLLISFIYEPKILLLDDILLGLKSTEKKEMISLINDYRKHKDISVIMTVSNLEDALSGDYLYIIKDSKIILEGEPSNILQNDNIINKLGLELPFMIDLSVKLRDYDLIKDIETDMDRLVNTLWK